MAFRAWKLFGLAGAIFIYILVDLQSIEVTPNNVDWCRPLTLMDGTPISNESLANRPKCTPEAKGLTALASVPGSGNTWMRYLLQQSTGILTGSIYRDMDLMNNGFAGESICNASVIVVKTHKWGERDMEMFSTAVLIVREPESSILAEFNRQSAGHVGLASEDRFTRSDGDWNKFVFSNLKKWEKTNLSWAEKFKGRLKIVFYDDLVANTEEVLRDTLKFIGHTVNDGLIKCAIQHKKGVHKREKQIVHFDPYTEEMHQKISEKTNEVYKKLGRLTERVKIVP